MSSGSWVRELLGRVYVWTVRPSTTLVKGTTPKWKLTPSLGERVCPRVIGAHSVMTWGVETVNLGLVACQEIPGIWEASGDCVKRF